MQPFYFLPDLTPQALFPGGRLSQAIVRERGMERIAWDVRDKRDCQTPIVEGKGPNGGQGMMLSFDFGRPAPDPGYYPDRQTWRQIGPQLWLGYQNDAPPTPKDLERSTKLIGYDVLLGGQVWHVPVLRRPRSVADGKVTAWHTQLPRTMGWDHEGKFAPEVRAEWRWLWERSAAMWSAIMEAEPDEDGQAIFVLEEMADLAIDALSANYRVDRGVASALQILDSTNWEGVVRAAIDWPAIAAVLASQKKTENLPEDGGESSSAGCEASSPTTAPAEPSSI